MFVCLPERDASHTVAGTVFAVGRSAARIYMHRYISTVRPVTKPEAVVRYPGQKADPVWSARVLPAREALSHAPRMRPHDEQSVPPVACRVRPCGCQFDEPLRSNPPGAVHETVRPISYDVVIAGAGPVGLFLACELRLAGPTVLVLEQSEPGLEVGGDARLPRWLRRVGVQ